MSRSSLGSVYTGRQSTRTGLDHSVARDPYRCSQKRAVATHDLAVEQHELARRMSGDSFGDAAGGNREEIGRAANRYAVIADAKRSRAGGADQLEGDFHLVIAAETALPADHPRTLQQVAGAVGGPGVADVVVAGEHQHPGSAQHLDRRHGQPAGTVSDECDAGLGHRRGRLGRFPLGGAAEAEAVADRHLAAKTERLGAGTDLLDVEEAHLALVWHANIEPDAVPRRDREDAVELPFRVAVDLQGIDAADQV